MRAASRETEWLFNDAKELVGIIMGADFCAEHEWGIKEICEEFGISNDPNIFGIERRRITNVPTIHEHDFTEAWRKDRKIRKKKIDSVVAITFSHGWRSEKNDNFIPRELYLRPERGADWNSTTQNNMGAAWSGGSFGIICQKDEDKKHLNELVSAIKEKKVAIWVTGRANPFGGGGFVIAIIDRIPADKLKLMADADQEHARLMKASEETGIIQKLKGCGMSYFACSPSFTNVNNKLDNSKYPVIYCLNPMDQRKNASGWFTVEELEQWIEGKGPVVKEAA